MSTTVTAPTDDAAAAALQAAVTAKTAAQPADLVTRSVDPDDFPWATWLEGIDVKLLRINEKEGRYTMVAKFAPGVQLPTHRHFGAVQAYTIQGRWRYLEYDWVAEAGHYAYEPPGSEHTLRAEGDGEDTIVLFTIEGGLIVFGPEGEYWAYEDATTAKERYFIALEHQGKQIPTGILS